MASRFDPNNPNTPTLIKEVNQAIAQMYTNGTLQKIYQTGGAYNVDAQRPAGFTRSTTCGTPYMSCIGNFLPTNPTNQSGCPELLK